jgi:hypothetical protein
MEEQGDSNVRNQPAELWRLTLSSKRIFPPLSRRHNPLWVCIHSPLARF